MSLSSVEQHEEGIGPRALRGETWVELFPWLDTYESATAAELEALVEGVPDWWIADSPAATPGNDPHDLAVALAAVFVRDHRRMTLADAAPHLDVAIPIAALRLDPRAETVVRRVDQSGSVRRLSEVTAADLFAIRGTSTETVCAIVAAVFIASMTVDAADGVATEDDENPALVQLIDDLRSLARWRSVRGRAGEPLLGVEIDDDAPETIQQVADRVVALTAADVGIRAEGDPVDEIENLVEQLDERESIVLHKWMMATEQISIGELSSLLHVSKSRAGTISAALKERLVTACDFQTAVGGLLASIRIEIQPVTTVDRLVALHPVLATVVPSLHIPLWLALDRIDDYFEVTGQWAAAPDVTTAGARTRVMLEELESENGTVAVSDAARMLGLTESETSAWLQVCAIPVVDGFALLATAAFADHVVAILEATSVPQDFGELLDRVDVDRVTPAHRRALEEDGRLRVTANGRWELTTTASDTVDTRGSGAVDSGRQPRRLYRCGDEWVFRVTVTADALRGSSLSIPAGVAHVFGCARGGIREIPSELGVQTLRWTGSHPTCGTIRRFLIQLRLDVGEDAFLVCSPDSGFAVRAVAGADLAGDPIGQALAMVGHRDPADLSGQAAEEILATAIGLPPRTKRRRILSAFQSRDARVAQLLEAGWVGTR
ncbi:hypothetical protein GCM10027169_23060 [Gordonia jinhuaensis]|uniref:Sigma-70, region 4 n=1 Tax=Gordonia jinhuaensis TaxID=1517702 RepID=A0A916TER5_9ACTN|nr:hypothetical protein [Gordonia jinhuaensis]GGB40847.1 hypothetical protein GCM10011489_30520 [Gordonia jinhuaensis]